MEAALVLPVLLLVLFALIDFGRMLNDQITVTEAAREAARAAAVGGPPQQRAQLVAGTLPVTATPLAACPVPTDTGRDAVVRVTHAFTFVTPVGALSRLFGAGGVRGGGVTLSSRAVMPCEQ